MVWRHPTKEGREFVAWAEGAGWTLRPPLGKGYAKLLCPCGSHQTWLHKTPSGANYYLNKRHELQRNCSGTVGGQPTS